MSKYNVYLEEVLKLNKEGLSNVEIGRKINLDARRVSDLLRKNNLNAAERTFIEPNELQKKVIIGSVIGDGSIFKSKANTNYRMNLAHGLKQKDYFLKKYEIMKSLIGSEWKEEKQFHKVNQKEYTCVKFQTLVNPYFTEIYSKWYKDGKKIMPEEEMDLIDEFVLAIFFFDDGFKNTSGYTLCLDDYSEECVKTFSNHLKNRFSIEANIHQGNRLYIPSKYKEKFKNIVLPFATNDLLYKI